MGMARILQDVKITEQELQYFMTKTNEYNHGSEGIIIRQNDKRKVRKIFHQNFGKSATDIENIEKISENKLRKLEKLYQISNFDNDVKIINTVSCDERLVGYDMISEKINYPYTNNELSKEEKIKFLKQIKKKLEYFHSLGIVYGDVRPENILIDKRNKHISFCDLDNIQIDQNPIDLFHYCICHFQNEDSLIDESIDRYMYNLLVLNEMFYEHYDYFHLSEKVKNDSIDIDELNDKGKINIKKMRNVQHKYMGGYLIDNLKK